MKVLKYIAFALLSFSFASCSKEMVSDMETGVVAPSKLNIEIGAYPAYGLRSTVSSAPGAQLGKTSWIEDDEIMVFIYFIDKNGNQSQTPSIVRYRATTDFILIDEEEDEYEEKIVWKRMSELPIVPGSDYKLKVVSYAYHKPVIIDDNRIISYGAGFAEEIYTQVIEEQSVSEPIRINFTRDFSRLRIYNKTAGSIKNITITDFKAAGTDDYLSTQGSNVKSDSERNIFLYGSWKSGSVLTVGKKSFTMESDSEPGKTYLIDLTK